MKTKLFLLVLMLVALGIDAEIKAFELSIDDPNIKFQSVEYYSALVDGYIRLGYLDNAERDLKEGLAKYPENIQLLLLHGRILFERGDTNGEYDYYGYLIAKYPGESKLYFARSYCDNDLAKYDQYLSDLKKTAELDSTNAIALGNIGLFYLEKNDFEIAEKYLTQAYAVDPLLLSTLNNIASVNYQRKKYVKAIEWATKAINISADNPIAYQIRGLSNIAIGNSKDGEMDLLKVKEIRAKHIQ
jgi:tetratricopeptide (TPR) repeat protein